MKHTYEDVIKFAENLKKESESSSADIDEDDETTDVYSAFIEDGRQSLSFHRDVLRDYYYGELDKFHYPDGLDLLCGFIAAGGLEITNTNNTTHYTDKPDVHTIIKEVFNDDEILHKTWDKYCPDESLWSNIWVNTYGTAEYIYYALINKFENTETPYIKMMKALIGNETNADNTLYFNVAAADWSSNKNSTYCICMNTIELCLTRIWMMFCGHPELSDHIVQGDLFDYDLAAPIEFGKIICSNDYGITLKNSDSNIIAFYSNLKKIHPEITATVSSDWVIAAKVASMLTKKGRAALFVSNGSLVNKKDAAMRKLLLDAHKIEAVITLPSEISYFKDFFEISMFNQQLNCSIVILNEKTDYTKLIDITKLIEADPEKLIDQHYYYNSKHPIDTNKLIETLLYILDTDDEDPNYLKVLTPEELAETDYALHINRYSDIYNLISDGVAFGQVIKSIRRGTSVKNDIIEGSITQDLTDYYWLKGSDIQEVLTDYNLPNIKKPEDKLEKYCAKNGNLIITKNGFPKKIAVVEIDENKRVLVGDNCFIIDLDKEKIDPYYLASFFNCDKGKKALERISAGTNINTISVADLKEILIPCPQLSNQTTISNKYQDILSEIQILRLKEAELMEKLTVVFFNED